MYRLKSKVESVAMPKGRAWEMLGRPRQFLKLMSEQRLAENQKECSRGAASARPCGESVLGILEKE